MILPHIPCLEGQFFHLVLFFHVLYARYQRARLQKRLNSAPSTAVSQLFFQLCRRHHVLLFLFLMLSLFTRSLFLFTHGRGSRLTFRIFRRYSSSSWLLFLTWTHWILTIRRFFSSLLMTFFKVFTLLYLLHSYSILYTTTQYIGIQFTYIH